MAETPQTEGSPVEGPLKPPQATCPQIDKVQQALRRLHWRVRYSEGRVGQGMAVPKKDEDAVLAEGLALLEEVRKENMAMRRAYYEMKERLKKAGLL